MKQQEPFIDSMTKVIEICSQIKEERTNHIYAIESARNKKIHDKNKRFIDTVILTQGKEDYDQFANSIKKAVFGNNNFRNLTLEKTEHEATYNFLGSQCIQWQQTLNAINSEQYIAPTDINTKHWYIVTKCLKIKSKPSYKTYIKSNKGNGLIRRTI